MKKFLDRPITMKTLLIGLFVTLAFAIAAQSEGKPGPQGERGATGLAGVDGINGQDGHRGPRGPVGARGPRGEAATAPEATIASSSPEESSGAEECDPNYAGACLDPTSSDYDCEGGSGDGPDYTGRVEVVGDDPYDLDRDGDGIACDV